MELVKIIQIMLYVQEEILYLLNQDIDKALIILIISLIATNMDNTVIIA